MDIKIVLQGIKNGLLLNDEEKKLINELSTEYSSWISSLTKQERYLIRKYTYNSNDDSKPNRFFEKLNTALRGEYKGKDKEKLLRYGEIISKAICKHPINKTIVCYRGVDKNLFADNMVGTQFFLDQLVSTSVVETGALKKKYKYVILVPKGTKGAYIEDISATKGQYEFLLDASCEYRLTAISGKTIYLEVVV